MPQKASFRIVWLPCPLISVSYADANELQKPRH